MTTTVNYGCRQLIETSAPLGRWKRGLASSLFRRTRTILRSIYICKKHPTLVRGCLRTKRQRNLSTNRIGQTGSPQSYTVLVRYTGAHEAGAVQCNLAVIRCVQRNRTLLRSLSTYLVYRSYGPRNRFLCSSKFPRLHAGRIVRAEHSISRRSRRDICFIKTTSEHLLVE